ncbi:OLC1v1012022C1 [Oldenlandia corymbosa var. corymbosa]|uniref:OLC1v1012022C1 n=1 Tax=Oldenlandia corymbosa var. corymbosa TaxID=529605 RepID=A0AAV1DV30_OLDCO|nr:OLC1v1012022C1 [Oldenlandia corymbosa var. corymbosa]
MATKLLQSLTDDNPDLQKQIGCMTGIFQLFDRQHIITPRRITTGPISTAKRPPPGAAALDKDSSNIYNRSAASGEKQSTTKYAHERQRLSTDQSSRTSFSSSSRSSSFSSLDYNKPAQPESLSLDRIIFPDTPSREHPAMSQLPNNGSTQLGSRQTLDLRDVVKDSMYRDLAHHGLPAKNATGRDETSPRPVQFSRSGDDSYGKQQDFPVDLKESLKVLAKLREAPWYGNNEPRELTRSSSYHSKDGSFYSLGRETAPPRLSYDGREMRNNANAGSFASSRDSSISSSLKFKELPRLSLDSRESSMRSFSSENSSQPDLFLKLSQKENGSFPKPFSSEQQKTGTQVSRPPSVVAKLMGLDAIPDSVSSSSEVKMNSRDSPAEESNHNLYRPMQMSNNFSKNLWKEPKSPRWRNPDSSMKPISRFPMEPAPWKQQPDGNRSSQKAASSRAGTKVPVKATNNSFPSVYSEIEKRLKDLEFSQSGKDLRALKQILEAMQAKGLLETPDSQEQSFGNSISNARSGNQRKQQHGDMVSSTSTKKGADNSNFTRNFESPIVIMKPAKLVEKSGIPSSSVISMDNLSSLPKIQGANFIVDSRKSTANSNKIQGANFIVDSRKSAANNNKTARDHQIHKSGGSDHSTSNTKDVKINNNRVAKSPQTSVRSPQSKEGIQGSQKNSGSISPRMQQKRQELEKRSKPPMPPSDLNRTRRHPNKPVTDSTSPGGRRRPKSSNFQQQSDDQLSEVSNESRNLNYLENETSAQSDGSVLSDSRIDLEVTSSQESPEMMASSQNAILRNSKLLSKEEEEESVMEHLIVAPEYPSPVSVLDGAIDMDGSPSPVKSTKKKAIRGNGLEEHDIVSLREQNDSSEHGMFDAVGSSPSSEISRKKLQNIENLVQKLRRLNSSHDEARTDYIASLCENTNPDHRYISEILLASGLLLRDLGSSLENFQFHPSGHPINPELFLVLEQTKGKSTGLKEESAPEKPIQLSTKERTHRKLIFDSINEILAKKLAVFKPSSGPWLRQPCKLVKKTLNAQKLLRELCSEIEMLQAKKPSECSSEEEGNDEMKKVLWEDVMLRSDNWTTSDNETSSMVLDVERLIFKDLISEVVIGEAASIKNRTLRRRQLFSK